MDRIAEQQPGTVFKDQQIASKLAPTRKLMCGPSSLRDSAALLQASVRLQERVVNVG